MPAPPRVLEVGPASVASALLAGCRGEPPDLGDTLVIVPTAGAARAIRRQLARLTAPRGVLTPVFRTPMDAVLHGAEGLASLAERETAWSRVLAGQPRASFAAVVPVAVKLGAPDDVLGVAGRLVAVCDTLAEAGLTPASDQLREVCEMDALRWEAFAKLYAAYLAEVGRSGLADPNEARLEQARHPGAPDGLRRIVVACVPDLPPVVETWLGNLAPASIAVEVFAWRAADPEARMDAWGRPDVSWWLEHLPSIPAVCLAAANDAEGEASALLDFVATKGEDGFALVAAASECVGSLSAEMSRRGSLPYSPEGLPLARTECASVVLAWESFLLAGRLHDLRLLLHLPAFLRAVLAGEAGWTAADALEACDLLMAEQLCETLEAAADWHRHAPEPTREDRRRVLDITGRLIRAAGELRRRCPGVREILEAVHGPDETLAAGPAMELAALVALLDEMAESAVLGAESAEMRGCMMRREIGRRRVFAPAPDGAVEIQGWLEAPWADAPVLGVAGCREGALPSGASEDAFLPDGIRAGLGLASQSSRLARDAYLLSCLLASRGAERVRLGFSRFRAGGEPNRPSRLLLGCPDADLPSRVIHIFHPPAARAAPGRPAAWKLSFEVLPPPSSIRATGFKYYLACPLRYYLSHVAGWQSFDPQAREISPSAFGTLMHRVLENFHKAGPCDERDERAIARFFSEELERQAALEHGRNPAPVVRVQVESMRERLRRFAALQAAERALGWKFIASEHAVRAKDGHRVGGLALSGTMDRVETHPEFGVRILDYKTFARPKRPEETHFGSRRDRPGLPEAGIVRKNDRGREVEKSWVDLQLPLYRMLAGKIWPQQCERGISAGYVLLPADADLTEIAPLELDDEAQASAEKCAAAVAERISRGIFWPPVPPDEAEYDDYGDWFDGKDPSGILDAETIRRLGGKP